MASIQEYSDGRWRVQIYRRGSRRSKTFVSRDDAKRWAAKMEGRIDATDTLALSAIPKRMLEAIASAPYTMAEIVEASIPVENLIGVYFLIKNDEVVYVGQSSINILGRIAKHLRSDKEFDSFSYMRCDKEDIDAMEAKYIAALIPRLNVSFGKNFS